MRTGEMVYDRHSLFPSTFTVMILNLPSSTAISIRDGTGFPIRTRMSGRGFGAARPDKKLNQEEAFH